MSDIITFECLHCHQSIEAPQELEHSEQQCPSCGKAIIVPKFTRNPYKTDIVEKELLELKNKIPDGVNKCTEYLTAYVNLFNANPLSEKEINKLVIAAYKSDLGEELADTYEKLLFLKSWEKTEKPVKDISEALLKNKSLNKRLSIFLEKQGVSLKKKKGFFSFFSK